MNLFVASELNWKAKGIKLRQETQFPNEETTRLTIIEGSSEFDLAIRYPGWVEKGALQIKVNGTAVNYSAEPSSYIKLSRKWNTGDVVEITFPMRNTIEHLPNVPEYIAFMHGPILLAAKTGTEDLKALIADDSRFGQYASGEMLPIDQAPILIYDDIKNIANQLKPVQGKPLTFKLDVKVVNPIPIVLEPFFQIHDTRYMMYWLALSNDGYATYIDNLASIEKHKLELERRTIDKVETGEQQPETDHAMRYDQSETGNNRNQFWRDARDGGYFSYEMATDQQAGLSLFVRYWGAEWGPVNLRSASMIQNW